MKKILLLLSAAALWSCSDYAADWDEKYENTFSNTENNTPAQTPEGIPTQTPSYSVCEEGKTTSLVEGNCTTDFVCQNDSWIPTSYNCNEATQEHVCEEGTTTSLEAGGCITNFICSGNAWVPVGNPVCATSPIESSSSSNQIPVGISSSSSMHNVLESSSNQQIYTSKYDCSYYNCVTTEYLNQEMLASGKYGEYLDSRDAQVYKTIVIGSQTWIAQNLNYASSNSYCAQDVQSNCKKYGRLYKSSAASSACFSGWHVPSTSDWSSLYNYIYKNESLSSNTVGKYLKSAYLWGSTAAGVDSYGFSAVPGGYLWYNGQYKNVGTTVSFWVKNGSMQNVPKYLTSADAFSEDLPRSTSDSFYIRCLKDSP